MIYKAFQQQAQFHKSPARIRGAFAGKRGGKTEAGAIECIRLQETKPSYVKEGVDPYMGVIVAPTTDMLERLSWKKFLAYGRDFLAKDPTKRPALATWHDGSEIMGISADKPERFEGVKANWIWIDEVFQVNERFFLECLARVGDSEGFIFCTGSLGVQYTNPKNHWAYRYFKEEPDPETATFEWATAQNPYFPKKELKRLSEKLDPVTFRQMFELCWDASAKNAVYSDLDDHNLRSHDYDPRLETCIAIDWGWRHDMACGFFQYDPRTNEVFLFDEIVGPEIKREDLWQRIQAKGYRINKWFCDPAGQQSRQESDGLSMVKWFGQPPRSINFHWVGGKKARLSYGISIVRSFIQNGLGQKKFFIDPKKCKASLDQMKNYRHAEKNGIISEDPIKEKDDAPDMIRYYFINRHDIYQPDDTFENLPRWGSF